ncbi:MAG: helix-turn-helix domain-containing protein [Bacteroidetes bacterium]|nr:helix-turn-helix domain-containing protein [Bacteroidota bacterium]MBS1540197.1 helix-turn-helix domain-containing protein [Bacteroidota bacterium]
MADNPVPSRDFISQVMNVIEQNMANEQFGVSELAENMNMSRSNLLRKVKKESKLSVSQLINQVRLKRAMLLLRTSSLNVSEVSHEVGFNSNSHFIKCFHKYYGYPPGEVGKHPETEQVIAAPSIKRSKYFLVGGVIVLIGLPILYVFKTSHVTPIREKSIAVLPFKNESNDSTNVYLINGLMESTLSNLQKIKDLRVVSRTSSEKYRNTHKSIPEMAKELNVNYFVEGSGQKIGDQIFLHIQLIDAATDQHVWSNQYKRESKDIFQLQQEIAKNVADEIKVFITPEEETRIQKKPTNNLKAYDFFLKGQNLQTIGEKNDLRKAIEYFKLAVQEDHEFALAYAEMAISYYYLDLFQSDKKYSNKIESYADKAELYDSKLGESLVAKAVAYMSKKEYEAAVPYLEKALEYNPNSATVIGFFTDFYALYMPNTAKYLQYALKGMQLNIVSLDSMTASYTYLRLGNALIQNGFVDESLKCIDRSLEYNPNNPFSRYVRAFVLMAKTGDAKQTRDLLLVEFNKDTTRFDILQDIGKVSYYFHDYKGAYKYYKKFLQIRQSQKLDVYRQENLIIAFVLAQNGFKKESEMIAEDYKSFLEKDKSIYRDLGYSAYYTYMKDRKKAVEYMKAFSSQDNVQYWLILFLEKDPMMEKISRYPEFKKYFGQVKERFWKAHDQLKDILYDQQLLP